MKTLDELLENTVLSPNGCMLWLGATSGEAAVGKTGRGYPRMRWHGSTIGVHRVVFKLANPGDPLLPHHEVDHCCPGPAIPNRLCIRPEHLKKATHKQNCEARDRRRRRFDREERHRQRNRSLPDVIDVVRSAVEANTESS